jgi:hypothetical protein
MSKIKLEPLTLPEIKKRKRSSSSSLSSSSKSIQSIELINYIKDIAKNFIKESIKYEVCGTFNLDSNDNIIGYSFNPNFYSKDNLFNTRNFCTYDNLILSSKIWHTHPDKYYPSNEDIFKIFKNKIKESYIISRFGYFKISFNSYINDLKEFNIVNIDKITREFYFSTNKGRDYNKDAINKLCKKLYNYINYKLKNKYLISEKFKISFYLYY